MHKIPYLNASSFKPNKTNRGHVVNIRRFAEAWRVDCMLDKFLFACKKLLNEQIQMKQNMKQNKLQDEQIIGKVTTRKVEANQLPFRINYLYE